MLDILTDVLSLLSSLGIIFVFATRMLPNEKLYAWGLKTGQFLNSFGKSKMGSTTWEKLEDFLVNSIGEYLKGVKIGLDSDEEPDE